VIGGGLEQKLPKEFRRQQQIELRFRLRNRKTLITMVMMIMLLKLAALYQWVCDGGFNWYAGVGGGVRKLQL
jgi:hypothetical protein